MNFKSFQNKLLDLNRTNNLINYKDRLYTSITVKSDLNNLFKGLLDHKVYDVFNMDKYILKYSLEKDFSKIDIEYDDIYKEIEKLVKENNILLYKGKGSVTGVLKNLKKKSLEFISEKGINVLYIAFGMINYEEKHEKYEAPLVLVPITIEESSKTFKISIYEEEIILNPNFRFKLLEEFKIKLRDISDDEDLSDYFDYVNKAMSKIGYYVEDSAYISLFSFTKINMYLDMIENEDKIMASPLVKGLLNENSILNTQTIIPGDEAMMVVDADHTQSEAIDAIRRGESIVLEGPPGTGKSQTITNIISSAIYDGKKVLFVSEKISALNVVYDKLKKASLSEFALELHSAHASKKEAISELYETLYKKKTLIDKKSYDFISELHSLESILDDYADTIHKKLERYGMSMYQMFDKYYSNPVVTDHIVSEDNLNEEYYNKAISLFDKYSSYESIIGSNYKEFSYFGFNYPKQDKKVIKILNSTKEILTPILRDIKRIEDIYMINIYTLNEFNLFVKYYRNVITSRYNIKKLYNAPYDELIELSNILNQRENIYNSNAKVIDAVFSDGIYRDKYASYYDMLSKFKGHIFKSFNKEYKAIMKELKEYSKSKLKFKNALKALERLKVSNEIRKTFDIDAMPLRERLGEYYEGFNTRFDEISNLLENLKKLSVLKGFKYFYGNDISLRTYDLSVINESSMYYDTNPYDDDIKSLFTHTNARIRDIEYLNIWNEFKNNVLNEIINLGLEDYVLYDNKIAIFDKAYTKGVLLYEMENERLYKNFNPVEENKRVNDFIKLDKNVFDINKTFIKEKLEKMKPNPDIIAPGSPGATIAREYLKKRRQMSVREIINKDPKFIQDLKPIFLMSPLSVSTYLGEKIRFDLVIFDEASQVFPEDAIGSIYRSSQMVVVGDSKQMPPSNFFQSIQQESESEDEEVSDFESILDMSKAFLKTYRLRWHYRSKNESLIAFSNKNFYDQSLTTFPSSKISSKDFGIEEFYVRGTFDRAKRVNIVEARKVIELLREHIEKYKGQRSIGIVAFSISQQRLIESLIDEAKLDLSNMKEDVFVKNLETVQGDERDTIIFSIGYGYDEDKKFIQNFGPLNRDGGERRLNVAITRARFNVKVVTSIKSSDIKEPRAKGAKLLKEYLEFANSLSNPIENKDTNPSFKKVVGEYISSLGYDVVYDLGYSDSKIDIVIKSEDGYKVAVECDSKAYYESKTARDRNRLRKSILESMGFKYIRVYSTAWFKNETVAKKILSDAIKGDIKPQEDNIIEVSKDIVLDTFDEYIYSNDKQLIEKYKSGEIDFEGLIERILENESPLSEKWFIERFKDIYEGSIASLEDEYELSKAMSLDMKKYEAHDGFIAFKNKEINLRIPGPGSIPRDISNISLDELAFGIKKIIAKNHGMKKEELFKKLNNMLGYKRMNAKIEERYMKSLDKLNKIAIVKISNGIIDVLDI